MTTAYATTAELLAYLPATDLLPDVGLDRMLQRAAELIDDTVRQPFDVDDDSDLPTDTDVAAAVRDASCAQVEFWLSVGEAHDVEGLAGESVSVAGASYRLPPTLAPRARRILHTAGLLSVGPAVTAGAVSSSWYGFFSG